MANLISILTRLSEQIIQNDEKQNQTPHSEKEKNKKLKLVRQKAFHVIHQHRPSTNPENQEWYPEIRITDYAYELLERGAEDASANLFESVGALEDSEYDCREILNFLLYLKGPFSESLPARQHPFSFSGSDYFLRPSNPFELLPSDLTCGVIKTEKSTKPTEEALFLDNFIEIPKKQEVPWSLPHLQDLVENELPTQKQTPKHDETASLSKPKAILVCPELKEDILEDAESTGEFETELKKPFLQDYSEKLNAPRQNPFALRNRKPVEKKREGLSLGMFLEEQYLRSLIEPSLEKVAYHEVNGQDFIDQLKHLLLGVDGRIFKYDAVEKKYFMKQGVYLDGIPPDCLFEVSQHFLESGTFYKNLSLAVLKGISFNSGVIYPAFWSCVATFLQDYSNAVVNFPVEDVYLMLLEMPRKKIFSDLAAVYHLCFPKVGALPTDGRLINYLFEYPALVRCRNVVFAIIYDCCVVYFAKLLEKWMFQGLLDTVCSEDFFIRKNHEVTCGRDRSLYGSVTINEEKVPSFLQNLALKILSCGKAIWLLKMCDPENKFLIYTETKKLPNLRLCFTQKEFCEMELEFKNYEKVIMAECGQDVTFKSLREAEQRENLQLVPTPTKPQQVCQEEKSEKEVKEEQNLVDNEKKLCTEFYDQLSRETERVKNVAEWRSKRMGLYDRRVEFLKDDLINDNTVFDQEGNVIAPTDADVENANVVLEKNLCNSPQKIKTDNEALQNKAKILGTTLCDDDFSLRAKPISEEAMRNKMKIMGINDSEHCDQNLNHKPMTEAMKNKLKIMGTDDTEPVVQNLNNTPLTEAMKNKLKIMSAEFESTKDVEEKMDAAPKPLTEAMKNKLKVLGTEYNAMPETSEFQNKELSEAMKNKLKVLGTEYNTTPVISEVPNKELTEAMKNKLKVLGTEYNIMPETCKVVNKEVTEAQKNKNRVLGTEIGDELPACPQFNRTVSGNELSEAQKNKLKVLGTDFDLPVPQHIPRKLENTEKPVNIEPVKVDQEFVQVKNKVNIFAAKPSEPSLLEEIEDRPKPDFEDMDIATFSRSIQRSLLVALNVQERLANSSVLNHFLVKENLMTHFTALRAFFLLQDGEFSRSLTYGLFRSLVQSSEPHQFFDAASLGGILNEALHCSHHGSLGTAQNVSFQILKMPKKLDKESHYVLSPFQLSYKVNWPINIVITGQILSRYRQVFHVLINLRRVHWMLNETFLLLKSQTKDQILDGKLLMKSPEYTKLSTYRHAMTLFIMTLEEHLYTNGLQEAWNNFMKQLETVNDLDHLYHKHVAFVKDISRRCFLSKSSQLLSYINELVELGLNFHHILNSCPWLLINQKQYSHPKFKDLKVIFNQFCKVTKAFDKALRKKIQNEEMAIHTPLHELIQLKIRF